MSTYINASGSIRFDSESSLNKGLTPLIDGGWLKKNEEDNNYSIWAESDSEVGQDVINVDNLTLEIPFDCYRNLGARIHLVLEEASGGHFQYYRTDGRFELRSWIDGKVEIVDTDRAILRLANSDDEIDRDVLTMNVLEFEEKHDKDYNDSLRGLMMDAFNRL